MSLRTFALKLEYHLFTKERAWLRGLVTPKLQAYLRRRARARYLLWDARPYQLWMSKHLARRQAHYSAPVPPGLLSIVTPVWDGTPLPYLSVLADSIAGQNGDGACEWVVLNNGCRKPELLSYFDTLKKYSWAAVQVAPQNAGIVGGLRLCLEHAAGRYILPVDSDDWLYPDCLKVVSRWIQENGFPKLLYSDEDKLLGTRAVQAYFKVDFDPVLLLNSAYIAHLGVIDREMALKLGAYSDTSTEGSPDWDLFVRFLLAGHAAVHIPEVIYSWRMHPESTADDALSKPYIHKSQQAVLQRYLDTSGRAADYSVEYSPLLKGTADWWLQRKHERPWPALLVTLTTGGAAAVNELDYAAVRCVALAAHAVPGDLLQVVEKKLGDEEALVCLISDDMKINRADWLWDALSLLERHPDAVMVGGLIRSHRGVVVSAGYVLGFGSGYECPDRGRPALDYGYFAQLGKQCSVSAVSSQFSVWRSGFLKELIRSVPAETSIPFLGAWAGAQALRTGKRVVYSPLLSGTSDLDWDGMATAREREIFREANADLMPDRRFYSRHFGLKSTDAYRLEDTS